MFTPESLTEVCDALDCEVLKDRDISPEGKPYSVYALGWRPELSAGLVGGTLTNWFNSEKELEDWCLSEEGIEFINSEGQKMFGLDWDQI